MIREQFGPEWQRQFGDGIARFRGHDDRTPQDSFELICRIPHVGPHAALIWKYPGLSPAGLVKAQNDIPEPMPRSLAEFLLWSNGLKIFGILLFGTTEVKPQPISLRYYNYYDRLDDQPERVVGLGCVTGYHSNARYYLHPDGHVDLIAGESIKDIVFSWESHEDMLLDEIRWFSKFHSDLGVPDRPNLEMLRPLHREWDDVLLRRSQKASR